MWHHLAEFGLFDPIGAWGKMLTMDPPLWIEWHRRKDDYNSFTTTTKMADIFEVRICRITEYLMLMNNFKYVSNYDPKPAKQQIEPAC